MDEERRRRIMAEARRNIADKPTEPLYRMEDPMTKWRREADEAEARRREAAEEWAAAEEARRARAAAVESVAALSARVESLRAAVYEGDEQVTRQMCDVVLPLIEKVAAKLEATIKGIDERVSRQLGDLEREVRATIKRHERGEVIEVPSSRSVN